jgi:hypothetical protein
MSRAIRSIRFAAPAILAALTTACSDGPSAPMPAAARGEAPPPGTGASAAAEHVVGPAADGSVAPLAGDVLFQQYGFIRAVNAQGAAVAIAKLTFTKVGTNETKTLSDNGAGDTHAALGTVRTLLPWFSNDSVRADAVLPAPYSRTATSRAARLLVGDTDFGTIKARRMPYVSATFRDAATGALLNGGALTVRRSLDGYVLATVADNGPGDFDLTKGRIKAHWDYIGAVQIIESTVPYPYFAPSNATVPATVGYEQGVALTWHHKRFVTPG